jgi:hypothetical protein
MPTKKCVSGCKGFHTDICNQAPKCAYINGNTRKYCRLSSKFKMGKPPKCNVTKRIKKSQIKEEASKKISAFLKQKTKKKNKPEIKLITKAKKPFEVIGKFMLKTGLKRKLHYLKTICSDSGVCIAFGPNSKKIIDFFDGFTNFNYVKSPIIQIGNPSLNGFVKQIQYEKEGYNAYAVLKSSASRIADNLVYEYIVGQFINKQNKFFPCFIETYGLYYYKNEMDWFHSKNTKVITTNILKDLLELQTNIYDYKKMCQQSKFAAILIQHLKNAKTLDDMLNTRDAKFIIYDLLYILYQIYMPLSILSSVFTHYDLHAGNVLLYEPIKTKYIEYHYHLQNNELINFKSPYIVKIIDYGRSFYKPDNGMISPTDIYNNVCSEKSCDMISIKQTYKCGSQYGFQWFEPATKDVSHKYYMNPIKDNQSYDLRLLDILKSEIKKNTWKYYAIPSKYNIITEPLIKLLSIVKYGINLTGKAKQYGTIPNLKSGLPSKINNVKDVEEGLRNIILKNPEINLVNNANYNNPANKIGDIHVYADGSPMRFVPV